MPEYKNNHYIPKSILSSWNTQGERYVGVYVFDIKEKKTLFSSGVGKSAFSFASSSDLYVPKINDERNVNVEKWLAETESTLSWILKNWRKRKNSYLFKSQVQKEKFIIALWSLKFRSKFVLEENYKLLREKPELLTNIIGKEGRTGKLAIVENMINAITYKAEQYFYFDVIFIEDKDSSLIMGDCPFLEDIIDGYNFVTLANNIVCAFRRSSRESSFKYVNCSKEFADALNSAVAEMSQEWIVSDKLETLDKYKSNALIKSNVNSVFSKFSHPFRGKILK